MCVLGLLAPGGLHAKQPCRKWHPGHYVLATNAKQVDRHLSAAGNYIRGSQVVVSWRALEPEEGVYDLTPIEALLGAVRKHDKQLFLQFTERDFKGTARPVPDYLYDDPRYNGGVQPMKHGGGSVARLWDPAVMERMNLLIAKLGKRFDEDPHFEGINFPESSLDIDKAKAPGYSEQALIDGMKSRIDAATAAFRDSVVIQYMNWGSEEMLEAVSAYLAPAGAGMGGPDLVPDEGRFPYKPRMPAYDYYPVYAGQAPLGTAVQSENLVRPEWYFEYCPSNPDAALCRQDKDGNYVKRKGDFALESFIDMGVHTLHLNYIFWFAAKGDRYRYQWNEDIVPFINAQEGVIVAECPLNHRQPPDADAGLPDGSVDGGPADAGVDAAPSDSGADAGVMDASVDSRAEDGSVRGDARADAGPATGSDSGTKAPRSDAAGDGRRSPQVAQGGCAVPGPPESRRLVLLLAIAWLLFRRRGRSSNHPSQ